MLYIIAKEIIKKSPEVLKRFLKHGQKNEVTPSKFSKVSIFFSSFKKTLNKFAI